MDLKTLVKGALGTQPAAPSTDDKERIKTLISMKASLPFKLHSNIDEFVLDGTSPDDAKIKLFDQAMTIQAAPPVEVVANPEPGPVPTIHAPATEVQAVAGMLPQQTITSYMKTNECSLQDAVVALAKGGVK